MTIMWRYFVLATFSLMVYAVNGNTEYNIRRTPFTKRENELHVIIVIVRTGAVTAASSVLVQTIPGTASSPADYTVLNHRREFIQDSLSLTVRIDLTDDNIKEDDEWFEVVISDPSTGMIGADSRANITILNDDAQFNFENAGQEVHESEGSVTITVVKEGYANQAIDVYVSTSDAEPSNRGRATPGQDFNPLEETRLKFLAGEDRVTVPITIIPDQIPEHTEIFDVRIVRVDKGEIGPRRTTQIVIFDNDVQYEIVEDSFSAKESTNPTQITVTISRKINLQVPGTIEVYTEDGTARSVAGDYTPVSTRVGFPMGENLATTTLTILDDNVYEPQAEVFYVGIRDPQPSGFVLESASRRPVTIEDNESLISMARTSYTVSESDESVTIQVRRTGDLSQSSTVRLRLIAISATVDTDYTNFDDVLEFVPNQPTVDVRIPIINDEISGEEDEVFNAELSDVTVSVLNTNASIARITIQDNPRLSTLAIVLIAVGGAAFVLLMVIMILCCCFFIGPSSPREPFYYDRGHRNVPGVDFPQESSGREAVVTYIPDDMDDRRRDVDDRRRNVDDRRRNVDDGRRDEDGRRDVDDRRRGGDERRRDTRQDRPRHSERRSGEQPVENGGPRLSEVNERERPVRHESNRASTERPQAVLPQERPREGRNLEPEDRHAEQSDPRRVRSMFNPRAEREPYWGKARHSHHTSPNHYGYF